MAWRASSESTSSARVARLTGWNCSSRASPVEAGEKQDLLHQGADPLDAATDLQQAAGVGLGVFRTQRDLGMGAQAGQRRADLMGGVAGQSAFGLEGGAQALEQEVEFVDEAADLQRHRLHRDRLQVSRGALLDLGLHFA